MLILNKIKELGAQRLLAIVALLGAIGAAYGAYSTLTWPGIAYYTFCIAALLFIKDRRVIYLLWFAVGFHAVVTVGYSLWLWQTQQIIPCIYCFSATGFALIAALVMYRLPVAILPVLLLAGMLYAWPYAFAVEPKATASPNNAEVQPAISPAELKPATTENTAGKQNNNDVTDETGKDQPTASGSNTLPAVSESPQGTQPGNVTQPGNTGQPGNTTQPDNTTPPDNTTQPGNTTPEGGEVNNPPGNEQPGTQPDTGENPGTSANPEDDKPKSG